MFSTTPLFGIEVRDSVTGAVYDSRLVSGYNGGVYLVWDIIGNATLRVTHLSAVSAVVSGFFKVPATALSSDSDGDGVPDVLEDSKRQRQR